MVALIVTAAMFMPLIYALFAPDLVRGLRRAVIGSAVLFIALGYMAYGTGAWEAKRSVDFFADEDEREHCEVRKVIRIDQFSRIILVAYPNGLAGGWPLETRSDDWIIPLDALKFRPIDPDGTTADSRETGYPDGQFLYVLAPGAGEEMRLANTLAFRAVWAKGLRWHVGTTSLAGISHAFDECGY